ncbi:ribosomal RNA large subunit methyltransferase G [Streptomyces camponoticapitis]|uniref:Ribosomal RNA large subunit methyltransferase G n=1 Tax=Streptomyces camponoticapitis TaxID=1616125 RepID=A0ABQ2DY32_9ACTN|nr:methyltransferase [Streptomyces camponoticapitis]GGJ77975.1 ribosomal RNA large subunit methyltransferase G [Streptomyces camponoticapitis]
MNRLTTPWGDLDLARFPEQPRDTLRAWDAADEYLLRHLAEAEAEAEEAAAGSGGAEDGVDGGVDLSGTVVVVGDRWGALATALAPHHPVQITDSYLTQRATRANLLRNGIDTDAVRLLSARDTPPGRIDVLLIRVPKSLSLLEDQLHRLAPALGPETVVVGTGKVTEIHTSTLRLFEQILGPTRTSLAVKKARLIFCAPATDRTRGRGGDGGRSADRAAAGPWPISYTVPEGVGAASGLTVTSHAGIFCAERLDIGTRFFLRNLPERRGREHVVDLGCGNGVVGTAVAVANPEARLTFIDESFSAVASAEATFRKNVDTGNPAEFVVGDALATVAPGSADLVLNNPPFHTHQATTDATAWRMFTGSREALRSGGELWVVGNRHLGYHTKLRRLFGNCDVMASDPKFVVLRAVRR